jgi:argininosuccinate synthase
VYRGLWYSQNRCAIDAYNAYTQKFVTGEVRINLCKGGLFVDGLRSDYALYDYNLATYDEGDTFDQSYAEGFIVLHGLQSKTWSKVQGPGSGLQTC